MKFYQSTQHDVKVKTDAETNQAFIKRDAKEFESDPESPIINDAIIENNQISEEEYSQ